MGHDNHGMSNSTVSLSMPQEPRGNYRGSNEFIRKLWMCQLCRVLINWFSCRVLVSKKSNQTKSIVVHVCSLWAFHGAASSVVCFVSKSKNNIQAGSIPLYVLLHWKALSNARTTARDSYFVSNDVLIISKSRDMRRLHLIIGICLSTYVSQFNYIHKTQVNRFFSVLAFVYIFA